MTIDELRKVAETATPGPWVYVWYGHRDDGMWDTDTHDENIGAASSEADAAHVAAFDPPTVLALLDRLAAAEEVADWLASERDSLREAYRQHNVGRNPPHNRVRPDLDTWANAYEVAERSLRAALTTDAT